MTNKIIIFFILLLWSCISNIQDPYEETISIQKFVADYNQLDSTYFFQVEVNNDHENVESVWVSLMNDESIDTTFFLNDYANFGDQIIMNNIYSGIFYIPLPFTDYQLEAFVQAQGIIQDSSETSMRIEEQFLPEIVDVIFKKEYEGGCGYEFDYNNSHYFINDEDTSYLNFQIEIKDLNGLENIQSVRYQTTTNWFYAEGGGCPNCVEECSNVSSVFYMTNIASNDSIFIYDAINAYIKEPGFPINPTSICDRFGVITFTFIAIDKFYGPTILDKLDIYFANCSEGNLEDCEHCPSECGECGE